jgi:hypothetical protein
MISDEGANERLPEQAADGSRVPVREVRPQVDGNRSAEEVREVQEPLLERHARDVTERTTAQKRALTSTYKAWLNMIHRCTNPVNSEWNRYGGRGIRVTARWATLNAFVMDMGIKPSPDLSLDRINNNGHYEPGNCRWANKTIQSANWGYDDVVLPIVGESIPAPWGPPPPPPSRRVRFRYEPAAPIIRQPIIRGGLGGPTPHSSFRLSDEAKQILAAVALHYGLTLTGALEMLFREQGRKALKVKK